MSWMQKLHETYDRCVAPGVIASGVKLNPLFHLEQQAHIEVAVDGRGNFRRAQVVAKENTVIPVTERSATAKTSAVVPHALCDHVKYCAGDYRDEGKRRNPHFEAYLAQLEGWCGSSHRHPKAVAILAYVRKQSLLRDLVDERVLPVANDGALLRRWDSADEPPPLFRQLTRDSESGAYKPQNALVRWIVEEGIPSQTWLDPSLQRSWIEYSASLPAMIGTCMVTGTDAVLAARHPKGLRGGRDRAALISWKNEKHDFTYKGRFLDATQALGVSREVSQKAHEALRWLIERQGYKNGDQVVVAWAVAGRPIPDPFADSRSLFAAASDQEASHVAGSTERAATIAGDSGQAFALRLNKAIAGYGQRLADAGGIVVMALERPTKGRRAITFYRELAASEFLDRLLTWHAAFAWRQDYGRDPKTKRRLVFIGAPSPGDIADTALGPMRDKKRTLHRATVERLLPCIVDGQPLPHDLMESAVRRACSRPSFARDEWNKQLGIACALFKGFFKDREYDMALEPERTSRDYLFGRLLAIAERIEARALWLADEHRDTNVARLMARFADRPASTWRTIELSLGPYKTRLRAKQPGWLHNTESRLDAVISAFKTGDFLDDRRLSGEFLLGYHCERAWKPDKSNTEPREQDQDHETEENDSP